MAIDRKHILNIKQPEQSILSSMIIVIYYTKFTEIACNDKLQVKRKISLSSQFLFIIQIFVWAMILKFKTCKIFVKESQPVESCSSGLSNLLWN